MAGRERALSRYIEIANKSNMYKVVKGKNLGYHIESLDGTEPTSEIIERAKKDGIKIISNVDFLDKHKAIYVDTVENRIRLKDAMDHGIPDGVEAIEFHLYGEAFYSGKEYNESIIITKEDFIDYYSIFGIKYKMLEDHEVSLGELDGKHSEVIGNIEVIEHTAKDFENGFDADEDDGCRLEEFLLETVFNEYADCNSSEISEYVDENFSNIEDNTYNFIASCQKNEYITVLIPRGRANEVLEFVKTLK